MAREELDAASQELRAAAAGVDDEELEQRIYDQSSQMADLSAAEHGPDHGRLARHENILHQIIDQTDGEVREHVEAALDHVQAYRSTVEGV